jgi:ribosomal subunit interface protein
LDLHRQPLPRISGRFASLEISGVTVNAQSNGRHCAAPNRLLCCSCHAVQNFDCVAILPDSALSPTGATMNVSISYKHVDAQQAVAKELMRRLDKLGKLLKSYQPDLIQLHGVFTRNQRTEEQSCSLTLSLPSGTLHATGNGRNVLAGCKNAFSDIESQIKRHQALLRREHEWKRKRRKRT